MDALRNLEVWQKSCRIAVDVYSLLEGCANRGYCDQLGRAVLSIASNVAEGYEREGARERSQYLKIAKGSCAEAWTQILIGIEAGFIPRDPSRIHADELVRIRKMLFALIRRIEAA